MIKNASRMMALALTVCLLTNSPLQAMSAADEAIWNVNKRFIEARDKQESHPETFRSIFDNNPEKDSDAPVNAFRMGSLPSGQGMTQGQLKATMLQNLDVISSVFSAQYGPGLWKESHEGWDLDAQINKAKQQVQNTPNITMDQYHEFLRTFFHSMKDYHVSVGFNSTEASTLPFAVTGTKGHYYISWIDRAKLSESSFPFKVGDELTAFGGKPTADVVKDLQARLGNNTALTDKALASMFLTSRHASSFGDVDKGPVSVTVKPQGGGAPQSRQLLWDYTPEQIKQPKPRENTFNIAEVPEPGAIPKVRIPGMMEMLAPVQAELAEPAANPMSIGSRESFLPDLGTKVWSSPDDSVFHAYIYQRPDKKLIGYVRISSYEPDDADAAVKEFGEIVKLFQSKTQGLVIDQVNNPGGSVLYLYALASMLTDRPLATPRHHVAITQEDVQGAVNFLKLEPLIKSDADALKAMGPSQGGYPTSYEFFRHLIEYQRFVIDQWNQGKTLTDPIFIEGVDQINPSSVAKYGKPILLLINELDFSGGDFFPAIMQDNKRATLFGTRTAGAGGFIREVKVPNQVGIDHFVVTGSIAVRADKQPIENLGVRADVQYAPTLADLQGGFADYAKTVDAAMTRLLGGPAPSAR